MFTLSIFFFFFLLLLLGVSLIPTTAEQTLRILSLSGTIFLFLYSLGFWLEFNPHITQFQQLWGIDLFNNYSIWFGLDALSLYLVLLTTFLFPLCILMSWVSVQKNLKYYLLLFLLLEFILVLVFLCLDFILFYLLFEFSLIPMFLLIGIWGSHSRKTKAAYYFFLYTLFGSLFMLVALIYLLLTFGSTNYMYLLTLHIDPEIQKILWPAIFIAFAIKIPMFSFHIWLPEAHVEAPTAGSVLLAGLILKLGGYGLLRYLLPLLPDASEYYAPFAMTLAGISAFYAALVALRQLDMKRIIAYSSIAHMNFGLMGLFSSTPEGVKGFIYILIGHGFISSALFFLVGVLYDRYHSRLYTYYTGLTLRMPLFSLTFFFFTIANVAFPGTFNFIAELLVFYGVLQISLFLAILASSAVFITTIYAFWLYNRIFFGTTRLRPNFFFDLTRLESTLFLLLFLPVLFGGLFPQEVFSNFSGLVMPTSTSL
jgi:NADH-quinone oxidoreductase subunit M